jgi:hypothetical protein
MNDLHTDFSAIQRYLRLGLAVVLAVIVASVYWSVR